MAVGSVCPTASLKNPLHPAKVTTKLYPSDYKVLKFQKNDGRSGNSKKHVMHFL